MPYPEPGIRLIKQNRIDEFNSTLEDYREQLEAGVRMMEDHYSEIKTAARQRLGSLYCESDYPGIARRAVCRRVGFPGRRSA